MSADIFSLISLVSTSSAEADYLKTAQLSTQLADRSTTVYEQTWLFIGVKSKAINILVKKKNKQSSMKDIWLILSFLFL